MKDVPTIIVAGGKGLRLGRHIPKQYLEVGGKPILHHTLRMLGEAGLNRFILVIDLGWKDYLEEQLQDLNLSISYMAGGKERFDSVMNGLQALRGTEEWVLIHDSVRPLISPELVGRLLEAAEDPETSCVIPVLPAKDTLKVIQDGQVVRTLDRKTIVRVGTPQLVRTKDYLEAVAEFKGRMEGITDDASLLERMGRKVTVVPGEEQGFKITDEFDLELFQTIIGRSS